jgi:hypothetical protein
LSDYADFGLLANMLPKLTVDMRHVAGHFNEGNAEDVDYVDYH